MKPFSFVLYDIKRLFGHGKTAILAILSPIPVLFLFATFLVPFLTADSGKKLSCAIFNEDKDGVITEAVNLLIAPEIKSGSAVVYPVNDFETGINLVKEGKVAAFLYFPPNTYTDMRDGEKAAMQFYYSKEHSFEALMFLASSQSTLSVLGQGVRIVYVATDIAGESGLSPKEVDEILNEGNEDFINLILNRGKIIGIKGVFSPGNDYTLRFAVASLFVICAYFVSFPVMYLTALDVSGMLKRRAISKRQWAGFYFARIISGSLLIMCAFLIMYPIASVIRRIPVRLAFSVFPAMLLTAMTFGALAVLIGSIFCKGHTSLWAGLYIGVVSILGVVFLSSNTSLPKIISFLMEISPLRAGISIFSNALFNMFAERYWTDMIILFVSFAVFVSLGFAVYLRRGNKV